MTDAKKPLLQASEVNSASEASSLLDSSDITGGDGGTLASYGTDSPPDRDIEADVSPNQHLSTQKPQAPPVAILRIVVVLLIGESLSLTCRSSRNANGVSTARRRLHLQCGWLARVGDAPRHCLRVRPPQRVELALYQLFPRGRCHADSSKELRFQLESLRALPAFPAALTHSSAQYAKLSDIYGRKALLLWSYALFAIGWYVEDVL